MASQPMTSPQPDSVQFEAAAPRVTLRNHFAHPYDSAIAAARAWGYYRELTTLLQGDARAILSDIWHIGPISHPKRVQKVDRQAEKRAIEVARYVLPVAAATTMVHTLSGIVLHRLWRMAAASDTPAEARAVIGEMVARVREIDPQFFDRFGNAPMEQEDMPEWSQLYGRAADAADVSPGNANLPSGVPAGEAFAREFDARLAGRVSLLTDFSPHAPRVVADAYRAVLGLTESACPDDEAIDRLLNPARNTYRLETLNVGVHAPIMRALQHANFTFAKKTSHPPISKIKRHGMWPAPRRFLFLRTSAAPNFLSPISFQGT